MASDIIAQGMAAAANHKATLALSKVDGIASGIRYIGEVDYYENLPSNPSLGDGYTVRYKTGGTDADGREFVWGKSQDGTKKWIEFGLNLDQVMEEIEKATSSSSGFGNFNFDGNIYSATEKNDTMYIESGNNIWFQDMRESAEDLNKKATITCSNGISFFEGDGLRFLYPNTNLSIEQMENYLSKLNLIFGTGDTKFSTPIIELWRSDLGLYYIDLTQLGGTGKFLGTLSVNYDQATGDLHTSINQAIYITEYSDTNLSIIQSFDSSFTYSSGGWQYLSDNRFLMNGTIISVLDGNESWLPYLSKIFARDPNIWAASKGLSKSFETLGIFNISPSDWIETNGINPFSATATIEVPISQTIDEDLPLQISYDNVINSVGIVANSINGTDFLTIEFYAINVPTVDISGSVGGIV